MSAYASLVTVTGTQDFSKGGAGLLFAPNVSRGIAGAWYPGISTLTPGSAAAIARMTKNFVTGNGGNLSGALTAYDAEPGFLGFTTSAYVDTLVPETANLTFLVVAKALANDTQGQFIGNFNANAGLSPSYASLQFLANGAISAVAGFNGGASTTLVRASLPAYADTTVWRMFSMRVTDGASVSVWDLTAQAAGTTLKTVTATALPRTLAFSNTIRLGAPIVAGYSAPGAICVANQYSVALTDAEVLSEAAMLRSFAAAQGISV